MPPREPIRPYYKRMPQASHSLAHHFATEAYNNAWANHRLLEACAKLSPEEARRGVIAGLGQRCSAAPPAYRRARAAVRYEKHRRMRAASIPGARNPSRR